MSEDKLDLRPGGVEILSTGLNLAELDLHGGEGFWDEVANFSRESRMESQVDAAMSGRSAPRVWAVMESPGSGPSAAAAGLAIARVLADRGQSVVLVDGDEQEPRITRWLGRVEMEGWIDMVRFGASLHAASDPLPSDNRRGSVLGVGSFSPTGVTPDEVADLLARLRRQADDLVLVLPAKLRSQPWLEAAHIKLLGWDLLTRSASDTEKVIAELDRMGARPDLLLGFGVEEFLVIQGRLREEEGAAVAPPAESAEAAPPDAPPEAPTVATPEPGLAPTTSSVPPEEEEPSPAPAGDEPEDGGVAAPAETVLSAEPMLTPSEPVEPLPKGRKGRSSGVFIVAAVVAVACLILLGVFLVQQRAGAPGAGEEQPVAAARPDEPADRSAAPDDGTAAAADARDDAGGDPAGGGPTGDPSRGGAAEETDETGEEAVGEASSSGRVEPEPEPEPVVSAPGQQPPTDQPAAQPAEAPGAAGSDEPEARERDMAPYQVPVGQDGWALWLYSLPEQDLAEAELRELERRGIRAVYRTVDIDDKGRWYRVYVGSFSSRAAANAAARDLKTVLDHDWVVPARF